MSKHYAIISTNQEISPHKLRNGHPPSFDGFLLFGTIGYRKWSTPAHKLILWVGKYILLGTSTNYCTTHFLSKASPRDRLSYGGHVASYRENGEAVPGAAKPGKY